MSEPVVSCRDRLLLAFANLAGYGVLARPAFAPDARTGHRALRFELLQRRPHGYHAYAFYTQACGRLFRADGSLTADLTVHYSGDGMEDVLREVCSLVSLWADDTAAPGRMTVPADANVLGRADVAWCGGVFRVEPGSRERDSGTTGTQPGAPAIPVTTARATVFSSTESVVRRRSADQSFEGWRRKLMRSTPQEILG